MRRPPFAGIAHAFDRVLALGGFLAAVLLLAVMLMTAVKVVFRYVLHEGLIGVDQFSGTLLLYITFLGAAWVLRREGHVTIDLLFAGLGPVPRRALHAANSVAGAAVCLVLAYYGALEAFDSWQRDIRIPAEIEMPRVINLAVIPLGCLLLGIQFARRALTGLSREPPESGTGRP